MSRLEAEPGVSAVTFSSFLPGFAGGRRIQFERWRRLCRMREPGKSAVSTWVSTCSTRTARNSCRTRLRCGRSRRGARRYREPHFRAGIFWIVDHAQGASQRTGCPLPLFTRAHAADDTPGQQEWYQIIGVVRDFPELFTGARLGRRADRLSSCRAGRRPSLQLSVRFNGQIPAGITDRFRAIGAEVDPALQLRRVVPLSNFYNDVRSFWRYLAWGDRVGDDERAPALRGRDLRADVVHRRAAHARDRHPGRTGCPSAPTSSSASSDA